MTKSTKIVLSVLLVILLAGLVVYGVVFGKPTEESAVQTEDPSSESAVTVTVEEALTQAETLAEAAKTACEKGNAVTVSLADGASKASASSVTITEDTVTLTAAGVYELSGTLTNGQIIVNTDGAVTLILNGVDITNAADAAVYIKHAGYCLVYLADGSENCLVSGTEQEIIAASENDSVSTAEGAALYARDNLSFAGSGSLSVGGYINNGIATTDRLTVLCGNLTIEAVNNGLKGKDSVLVLDGTLNITSGNDGIKSNNDTDEDCGTVEIRGGIVNIAAFGDGVQSEKDLTVADGTLNIATGTLSESESSQDLMTSDNLPAGFGAMSGSDFFANIDGITDNGDGTITVTEAAAEQLLAMASELFGESSVTAEEVEACSTYEELMSLFMGGLEIPTFGNMPDMSQGGMQMPSGDMQMPSGDMQMPSGEMQMPSGEMQMPSGEMQMPGGDMQMPSGGMQGPGGGMQMPGGSDTGTGMTPPSGSNDTQSGADGEAAQPLTDSESESSSASESTNNQQQSAWGGDFKDFFDRENSLSPSSDASAKGLKSGGNLTVTGGSITVVSSDDCIHADGSVTVTGGILNLASGDDGIHADDTLTLDGGEITITQSYEGLEAHLIYITGGDISVTASDDGLNANGGSSVFGAVFSSSSSASTSDDETMPTLQITGGTLYVKAGGDGLDSNGDLIVEGGTVIVDGPSDSANGALDSGTESGGVIRCNGGTVLAIGASGMAECFDSDSTQPSFLYNFSSSIAAGSEITITDANGNVLFTHTAAKSFNSVVFTSADLTIGTTITLTAGDQSVEISIDAIANGNSTGFGGFGGMGGGFRR